MKKLLFIALIAFINLKSYGQNNPHSEFFDKIKNKKEISFKNTGRSILNANPKKLPLSSIPTTTKYSTWHQAA